MNFGSTLVTLYVPASRQLVGLPKDEVAWSGPANCSPSTISMLTEEDTKSLHYCVPQGLYNLIFS